MASSAGALKRVSFVAVPAIIPALTYGAIKLNVADVVKEFFLGPGKYSRILAVCLVWYNWKSLPFSWTVCQTPTVPTRSCMLIFATKTPVANIVARSYRLGSGKP